MATPFMKGLWKKILDKQHLQIDTLKQECISARYAFSAKHHHDCQYVGCIEKSQCPAWSAEKDYEAAKAATDAAKALE